MTFRQTSVERAYRLYRERGDRPSAARMAIWLTSDYFDFRGEPAIADGWFQRARRLLEGLDPTPEHAWLTFMEGYIALLFQHDAATVYAGNLATLPPWPGSIRPTTG